jgi:pyridoxine kinase
LVNKAKSGNPDCLYLCDPVLGDHGGGLYVADPVANAIRDDLLPLADITTPNAFECAWLAGADISDTADLAAAAQALAPETVIVTSSPALMRGHIGNLLVDGNDQLLAEHPEVQSHAKGTGDLLAALYLGRVLQRRTPRKALEMAAASTFEIMAAAAKSGADDLPVAQMQTAIAQPHAMINLRQMAPKLSSKPRPL